MKFARTALSRESEAGRRELSPVRRQQTLRPGGAIDSFGNRMPDTDDRVRNAALAAP